MWSTGCEMNSYLKAALGLFALCFMAWPLLSGIWTYSEDSNPRSQSITSFLSDSGSGDYETVVPGYRLEFPKDHGAHPGFRQEWWYFTGNLESTSGKRFGYQLTFFRFATGANPELPKGGWNSDQTWMSHFVISDVDGRRFIAAEDFARGGLGLGGAESAPFRVWTNGWFAAEQERVPGCEPCLSLSLSASTDQMAIDLQLDASAAPILHGDQGYSKKQGDGSVASYYYSFPDLTTDGVIEIAGERFDVVGESWMDREWSSAILGDNQIGWDWFAVHLDDGRNLMMFKLRSDNDDQTGYYYGVLHQPDGAIEQLAGLQFQPTGYWRAPVSGANYPVSWSITGGGLDLQIEPWQENQEVNLLFTYYEGAISITGTVSGSQVAGRGYMELTGYETD